MKCKGLCIFLFAALLFGQSDTASDPFYTVSPQLGGISTANGGNVTISAGLDVISYLPSGTHVSGDAGTGAFGKNCMPGISIQRDLEALSLEPGAHVVVVFFGRQIVLELCPGKHLAFGDAGLQLVEIIRLEYQVETHGCIKLLRCQCRANHPTEGSLHALRRNRLGERALARSE